MLSTELTSHLIPRHKFFFRQQCRRVYSPNRQLPFITHNSTFNSSSSSTLQQLNDDILPHWETIPLPPVTAAKRVVLVRHGQSTWNAEGRIQGSSDYSVLTLKGESQAETSRLMLLDDSFDVCFSRFLLFFIPLLQLCNYICLRPRKIVKARVFSLCCLIG